MSEKLDVSEEGFVESKSVFCWTTWFKPGCAGEIDELLESWVLKPLQKTQSLQEGKFSRLTGTDLANIITFIAISGFNKMVKHGRLRWWDAGALLPVGCYCSSQRPTWCADSSVCSEPSALNGCFKWRLLPKAWTWTCASRNNMYYSGTHSFKTNFQVKTRILKVKSPSSMCVHIYIHIYTCTHTHFHSPWDWHAPLLCF